MTIREELEHIKGAWPMIRPEAVVAWARANPDSALHKAIEWDDEKAADEYRIWQVRRLIAVHVVDEEGERKFVSLSIDRVKGGGYRDVEEVVAEPELATALLNDALAELRRVQAKYKRLKALAGVWRETERVARAAGFEQEERAA